MNIHFAEGVMTVAKHELVPAGKELPPGGPVGPMHSWLRLWSPSPAATSR